jgi:putative ABC transport system permease protein
VLTEELAKKYFNNEDPINKTLYIDKDTVTVKGVLAKLPDHFHLDFHYLVSLQTTGIPERQNGKVDMAPVLYLCEIKTGNKCSAIAG